MERITFLFGYHRVAADLGGKERLRHLLSQSQWLFIEAMGWDNNWQQLMQGIADGDHASLRKYLNHLEKLKLWNGSFRAALARAMFGCGCVVMSPDMPKRSDEYKTYRQMVKESEKQQADDGRVLRRVAAADFDSFVENIVDGLSNFANLQIARDKFMAKTICELIGVKDGSALALLGAQHIGVSELVRVTSNIEVVELQSTDVIMSHEDELILALMQGKEPSQDALRLAAISHVLGAVTGPQPSHVPTRRKRSYIEGMTLQEMEQCYKLAINRG